MNHALCATCNQVLMADIHVYGHEFVRPSPLARLGAQMPPVLLAGFLSAFRHYLAEGGPCTCSPCRYPGEAFGPGTHCAGCCFGTLIEEYDLACPVAEHRDMARRQYSSSPPPTPEPERKLT